MVFFLSGDSAVASPQDLQSKLQEESFVAVEKLAVKMLLNLYDVLMPSLEGEKFSKSKFAVIGFLDMIYHVLPKYCSSAFPRAGWCNI